MGGVKIMHNFKELIVWKKSREFVKSIYMITNSFPAEEKFGLAQQIRRASISIASNIAEGAGRNTPREFIHFLNIAYGSACEVETQLCLSLDLNFISKDIFLNLNNQLQTIQKLIFNFKKTLISNTP